MFRDPAGNGRFHARALFGAGLAIVVLFVALAAETGNLAAQIVSLILGAFAVLYVGRIADRRLRARGKSMWWLLLFFGPLGSGAVILERLPQDNEKLMVLALLAICIVSAPFAIWGFVELTSAPRSPDT